MTRRPVTTSVAIATVASSVVTAIAAAALWAAFLEGATPNYSLVSTSAPPVPPGIPLAPNDQGYVRLETKSGSIRCSVASRLVACQTSAGNWPPRPDGLPYHVASVTADGEFNWVNADLGALEGRVTLDYQTYRAQGWKIVAAPDGMTFGNDRTGHGMSVSEQRAESF
jgi:hypothetical protein